MEFGSAMGEVVHYEVFAGRGEYITQGRDRFNQGLSNYVYTAWVQIPALYFLSNKMWPFLHL